MKNNSSENPLEQLQVDVPDTPLHAQRLRRALLSKQPTHSLITRMAQFPKALKIASSIATITAVVVVAGYTIFNEKYAPHAQARELATQSIQAARQLSPAEIASFDKRFGGTPEQALVEAQSAADLKIISQEEFQNAFSKSDGGSISMSVGAPGDGPSTMSSGTPPEGGSIMVTGSATAISGDVTSGPVSTTGQSGALTLSAGTITPIDVTGTTPQGAVQLSTGGGVNISQSTTNSGPTILTPVQPLALKYLQYTNSNGDTVIIGMNDENKPVMKAVISSKK